MTIRIYTRYSKKVLGIDLIYPVVERCKNTLRERLELMLLSIDFMEDNLQPEKNIDRAIDITYKISF